MYETMCHHMLRTQYMLPANTGDMHLELGSNKTVGDWWCHI